MHLGWGVVHQKWGEETKFPKKDEEQKRDARFFGINWRGKPTNWIFSLIIFFPPPILASFNNVDSPAPSIDYLRFKSFWQVDIPFWSNSSLTPGCVCSRFLFKWQKFQNSHSWLCSYYIILALYLLKFSVVIQSYLY